MGAFPRWRALPAPLWVASARRGHVRRAPAPCHAVRLSREGRMLTGALFSLARPLFQAMDPERAHGLAIAALKAGIYPRADAADDPRIAVRVWGLDFSNPLGMAAGFDKNGEVPSALLALGFASVELGTVTPRPQQGNPRPRIFRLPQDAALMNRLGFNSDGHAAVRERLRSLARRGGVVGVNIGANKDSADRIADY